MGEKLIDLLAADLPYGFAHSLVGRIPLVYAESYHSVTQDPRCGDPEARYLHGHVRRALIEATLREEATLAGMTVAMRRADGVGGPEHVMVSIGRFCFTACHLPSLSSFPRESKHREQYSALNEHIAQGQLFPLRAAPDTADIYGVVVHCEVPGNKEKVATLCIGFPNENCDDWIDEPIPLIDIADMQEQRRNASDATDESARPTWKEQKDNEDQDHR